MTARAEKKKANIIPKYVNGYNAASTGRMYRTLVMYSISNHKFTTGS